MTIGRHGRQRSSDLALSSKWDEKTGERRLDTSGHPFDLSDLVSPMNEANNNSVPPQVLKSWHALPDAVRLELVNSELSKAGLSTNVGLSTSPTTNTSTSSTTSNVGLTLSDSFGSTIRTECSPREDEEASRDIEEEYRDADITPRSGTAFTFSQLAVSKVPTPPHLLGLRAPDSASLPNLEDPPVLRVLNAMPEYPIVSEDIKDKLQFSSLIGLLPGGAGSAVLPTDGDSRKALTHERLREFVEKFDTLATRYGILPGDRVGIAMPNGPELGVCLLSVCSRACSVPVNPDGTTEEICRDLEAVKAKAIIALGGQSHLDDAAKLMGIPMLRLVPSDRECGLFTLVSHGQISKKKAEGSPDKMSGPQDHSLVLFTSGTSGKKKIVPYTLSNLVIGTACIIKSWGLRPDDINLNMMPLFHIGGIARNVFSPFLSGGGVVLCPGFDPVLFWDLLSSNRKKGRCTWYYASPTMHQAYVEEAATRAKAGTLPSNPGIRFIANAAGALLPALAERMKTTFNCSILPGYGMTECMPITAPPQGYQLERHGSSGRPVGPEVKILNNNGEELSQGEIGNICVRGAPCFEGYEGNEDANAEAFLPGGWFNTGDLGWVDADDYLYITGRSKEVINRGGEIISPFEVEECLLQHPDILKPLCFAAPHDTLQETVGVALVMRPGCPRPTMKKLKKFCAGHLHPSKWPSVICFVDDLPKGPGSGKPQRVRFAERIELKELSDAVNDSDRLYEAKVPPAGTPLSVKFPAQKVLVDDDDDATDTVAVKPRDEFEERMSIIWQEHLDSFTDLSISVDSSFFEVGGSSLMAGQLASSVRREFSIGMGVSDVFQNSTIETMANFVRERSSSIEENKRNRDNKENANNDGQGHLSLQHDSFASDARKAMQPRPPTRLAALFVQILPLFLWAPLRRAALWIAFIYTWRIYLAYALDRYFSLILALGTIRIAARAVMPFVGILCKWLIMGRYKRGRHPYYSTEYLRWWACDQILAICGRGIFGWSNSGLRMYLRLMGAKVGTGVIVDTRAKIGEYDLLTFEDHAVIDSNATIRPFTLDRGTILLEPIHIGRGASVGFRSIVAPGARVKDNTSIGPQSSSHAVDDHVESNKNFNLALLATPRPAWKALGYFIVSFVNVIAYMPVLVMLFILTRMWWYHENLETVQAVYIWFSQWQRVLFYLGIKAVNEIVCPWMYFFAVVMVKRTIIGRFTPGPRDNSGGWGTTRHWIMATLLPSGSLGGVTHLLGKHYEAVSWCLRLLGAKIGTRIYWPGSGVKCTEHDLLSVGNDVVFGSRSTIITSDTNESAAVSIEDGCFVADRCVVLPGVQMKRNSTIGSGGLAPKNFVAPPGSVFVGSEGNKPVRLPGGLDEDSAMKEPTIRPFGKAFHRVDGFKAPYFVYREWMIIMYHHLWYAVCAMWHAAPIIASLQLTQVYLGPFEERSGTDITSCFLVIFPPIFLASQLLSLFGVVGIKWAVIGKRNPGSYRWDESNYCQRWQVFLCAERLRQKVGFGGRGILDFIRGSAYLNWYYRALGAKIGDGTCLYPTGGDPMMTEPDCVEIGDNVGIDEASIISHLNTKGNFSLQLLRLGDFATMRSSTRLLAGASMEANSRLLEHTLIYSGEVTQAGSTWQGWPAKCVGLSTVYEDTDDDASTFAEV